MAAREAAPIASRSLLALLCLAFPGLAERRFRGGFVEESCVSVLAPFDLLVDVAGLEPRVARKVTQGRYCPYADGRDLEARLARTVPQGVLRKLVDSGSLSVGELEGGQSVKLGMGAFNDVNVASHWQLSRVDGVGEELAEAILAGRTCPYEDEAAMERRIREHCAPEKANHTWWQVKGLLDSGALCRPGAGSALTSASDVPAKGSVAERRGMEAAVARGVAAFGAMLHGIYVPITALPPAYVAVGAQNRGRLKWDVASDVLRLRIPTASPEGNLTDGFKFYFSDSDFSVRLCKFQWPSRDRSAVLHGKLSQNQTSLEGVHVEVKRG